MQGLDDEWVAISFTLNKIWTARQAEMQSELGKAQTARAKLLEDMSLLQTRNAELEKVVHAQETDLKAKQTIIEHLQVDLAQTSHSSLTAEVKVLRERLASKDQEIGRMQKKIDACDRKEQDSVKSSSREVERLRTVLAFRDAELKQLEWKVQELAHIQPIRQQEPVNPKEPTKLAPLPAKKHPLPKPRRNVLRDSQETEPMVARLLQPLSSPKKAKKSKPVFVNLQHPALKGINILVEAVPTSQ